MKNIIIIASIVIGAFLSFGVGAKENSLIKTIQYTDSAARAPNGATLPNMRKLP